MVPVQCLFFGGSASFSHYVSHFSYVWTPESPSIWERAAVYQLSHLSIDATSCCEFFPLVYYGRSFGSELYLFLIVALFNYKYCSHGGQPTSIPTGRYVIS